MSVATLKERPEKAAGRRQERLDAMIAAAEELFLEVGYEQTTLSAVVQRSGGSLATLYQKFGNKQGLLRAVIIRMAEAYRRPALGALSGDGTPSSQLREYARAFYAHLTSPTSVALKRIVLTEAMRDPDFAQSLYLDLHMPTIDEIAQVFEQWNTRGDAAIDNTHAAADLLFSTITSDAQTRVMCMSDMEPLCGTSLDWRLQPFIAYFKIR